MSNRIGAISAQKVLQKAVFAAFFTAFSIILPQVFHAVGNALGISSAIGTALLPMHLPVLAAGFLCGPYVGLFVGIASPVISHFISAMPAMAVLPFITIELAFYGAFAGILTRKSSYSIAKLITVQIIGRAARALAVLAAFYIFGSSKIHPAAIAEFIKAGIPGIVLQWIIITAAIRYFEKNKNYEYDR